MPNLTETIQALYRGYRGFLPDVYRWEDEKDRWYELVFCLFYELVGLDDATTRRVVGALAALGLLDPAELAQAGIKGNIDVNHPAAAAIATILDRNGVNTENRDATVIALCELSRGLQV